MATFIVLTSDQADAVRGMSEPGALLEPILMADGRYALPMSVMVDPAHQAKHDMLSFLPQESIDPAVAWPAPTEGMDP